MRLRRITREERVLFLFLYYFLFVFGFITGLRMLFSKINASSHLAGLTPLDWLGISIVTATFILALAYMLKRALNTFIEAGA